MGVRKTYRLYKSQADRLKQGCVAPLRKLAGLEPKQYYREHIAVDDVSFEVRRGETFGVIGHNGSGKSTLLQLIAGTLTPTGGRVDVNGRVASLLELGAGFHGEFTGRENVYLNGVLLGLSKNQVADRFEDILAFADIGSAIDQPVKTYSSGMYVRLAFAVIANVDADILVIDEALAVGDAFFAQKCMRFLHTFSERGSIIFVSHDTSAILNLCDRCLWLERGKMQLEGSPKEVSERYLASRYQEHPSGCRDQITAGVTVCEQEASPMHDMRLDFINQSTLRNDIQAFSFSGVVKGFRTGGGYIASAGLYDQDGRRQLSWVVGGELACVVIHMVATADLRRIVAGFFIKDRFGQTLFGENTYAADGSCSLSLSVGESARALFRFRMPILPKGTYTADVAIADGDPDDYIQLQWVHDAFSLESHSSSTSTGLIGIPFGKIEIRRLQQQEKAVPSTEHAIERK